LPAGENTPLFLPERCGSQPQITDNLLEEKERMKLGNTKETQNPACHISKCKTLGTVIDYPNVWIS